MHDRAISQPCFSMQKFQDNLNAMIPLFLRSADNVQPIFGVVGAVVKLETALFLEEYVLWFIAFFDIL